MPQVYLPKELYDQIVKNGRDPSTFVTEAVRQALKRGKP
jgi:hypothetical protein